MKRATVRFHECEHDGDMERYVADLTASGAKVLATSIDEDEEEGTAGIEVENVPDFLQRLKQTESAGFSNIWE